MRFERGPLPAVRAAPPSFEDAVDPNDASAISDAYASGAYDSAYASDSTAALDRRIARPTTDVAAFL